AADATISTATNGRVIVGGDLNFGIDGLTTGLEMHSYPWTGPGPFTCLSVEPGGFTVAKSVVGDGADLVPAGTAFTVAYSYTANGTPVTGTLTVKADGTVVDGPTGLPAGTVVTLSEPDLPVVAGVEWGTPSFAPSDTVTIGASGKIAVRLTNTASAQLGGFSVAKALTGLAAGQVPAHTEFTVAYTVTVDGTSTQGTVKVLADGTVVDGPQDLPVGAVVTFTEIDLPTVPGVVWGAPSFDPASVTVVDGANPLVTLTNAADAAVIPVGGFSVQKVVDNAPAGTVPADTAFTVAYSYELDGTPLSGTLTVRADGAVVDGPQNLPAGTVVTFGEVSLPDVDGVVWGAPVFSPENLVVGANENAKVTLTNTAEEARAGGFSMAKSVTGAAAGKVPAGTEFEVRYSYDLDGVPTSGTMTVTADGTVVDGPQNLREGTVVTFEEIALPAVDGVVWGTPVFSPESLVVGANEKAKVTLTNTALDAPAGGFSLAKAVTGLAADQVPPQNLPVGTVVTFDEIDLPSVDGVVWGAPVFSPASVTIADGENALVTVTNTANAVVVPLGGFSMAKSVTGEAAGRVPAGTEFTATYEYTVGSATLGGTLTLLADGTVVDGPQNLVAGTVVTFTELAPAHVVGVEWGTPVFSPASVTIGSGENTAVMLTNTANLAVGTFSVTKVVTGEAADLVPDGTEFTVQYSYEQDGQALSGSFPVLADGTPVTFPGHLVEGTVVTLGEVNLPDIDGLVWGTPVFSPDVVTIGADQTVEVTLTNTADAEPAGGFSLSKTVMGATAGQVPADTEFSVAYSYDLGGSPTSGTLVVRADGTVVDGPQNLPVGTVVTFDEIDLPSIDGVVWGAPEFSPASVTVGDGENTAVTLTNTADAEPAGGFSLTKVVGGSGASVVPAGTEFTVAYSYELDGAPVSGTSTVAADGTVVDGPQNLPVGTVVTFSEIDLPAVAGVVWGTPVFSPAQVTVTDGENAAVTLTNTADVVAAQVGGFTIVKKVTGTNASKVPADTQFTVAISGTVNGEHTEGSLTVRADGTVVEGPANLPAGTVVDLTEVDLPKVAGVRWGTPVFTVDGEKVTSVTIGAGQTVAVTLTNTANAADGLAATGARVAGIAAVALLLVGGGGALLVGARRRRA
ncbi:MAG: choice-of-anchor family protein, partial [Oerskovia sp.]|nr:choice-of-anchor family protein [Oerskovia sp.]